MSLFSSNPKISSKQIIWYLIFFLTVTLVISTAIILPITEPNIAASEIIKVVTGELVLIGLIYSARTYELAQEKNRHDIHMNKVAATHSVLAEWYKSPLADHVKNTGVFEKTENFKLIHSDLEAFYAELGKEDNHHYQTAYISLFNYFESIAIATNEDLLDEKYLKRYFAGIFISYFNLYIPLIKHRRIVKDNQGIWAAYTDLAIKWKKEQASA